MRYESIQYGPAIVLIPVAAGDIGRREVVQAIASLQVNDITLNWTETGKRALKTCNRCKKPTRGRLQKANQLRGLAVCSVCAMKTAFQMAEAKLRRRPARGVGGSPVSCSQS